MHDPHSTTLPRRIRSLIWMEQQGHEGWQAAHPCDRVGWIVGIVVSPWAPPRIGTIEAGPDRPMIAPGAFWSLPLLRACLEAVPMLVLPGYLPIASAPMGDTSEHAAWWALVFEPERDGQ